MQEILTSSLSEFMAGLSVEGVMAVAGPVSRRMQRGKFRLEGALADGISHDSFAIVSEMLSRFGNAKYSDRSIDQICAFIQSSEAHTIFRQLALSRMALNNRVMRADVERQIAACLNLLHNMDSEQADDCAPHIWAAFNEAAIRTQQRFAKSDKDTLNKIVTIAQAEIAAGYLRRISERSTNLLTYTPEEVAEVRDFAKSYIRLMHQRTRELVPAGLEAQPPIPIDELYVLPAFKTRATAVMAPYGTRDGGEVALSLEQVLRRLYRTVILGTPGAGKSTLGQRLMHDFTSAGVDEKSPIIPFLVVLREYDLERQDKNCSLVEFVAHWVHREMNLTATPKMMDFLFATGQCLVILDGLDELTNSANRRAITRSVEDFGALYPETALLVTSRLVGYSESPLNPEVFQTIELSEFSNSSMREYVEKWFRLQAGLDAVTQQELAERFLRESESVADLRTNPLMLSLLCAVYRRTRNIPQNRAELYEDCALLLFLRWDEQRGVETPSTLRSDARIALQEVAYWVLTTPDLAGGISRKRLVVRLTKFWARRFEDPSEAREEARRLVALWRGRAWVLTDTGNINGDDVFEFTHRTFLEYFAALHLVRTKLAPEDLWDTIMPFLEVGEWDIVGQLAIQAKEQSAEDATDKIYRDLLVDAEASPLRERVNLLLFASRNLTSLMPSPKTCRSLVRAAIDLALVGQPLWKDLPSFDHFSNFFPNQDPSVLTYLMGANPGESFQSVMSRRYYDLGHVDDDDYSEKNGEATVPYDPRLTLTEETYTTFDAFVASPDEMLGPLRLLLESGSTLTYVREEIHDYLGRVVSDGTDLPLASKAYVLANNLSALRPTGSLEVEQKIDFKISKSRLLEMVAESFSAGLCAFRTEKLSISELISLKGWQLLFCSGPELVCDHPSRLTDSYALTLAVKLASGSPGDILSSEEVLVLDEIGRNIERTGLIDSDWMRSRVSLFSTFVRSTVIGDGSEPEIPEGILIPNMTGKSLMGAWLILALFHELSADWPVFDNSEDQLVRLQLGSVQLYEPIFLARRFKKLDVYVSDAFLYSFYELDKVYEIFDRSSLDLIDSWARGDWSIVA